MDRGGDRRRRDLNGDARAPSSVRHAVWTAIISISITLVTWPVTNIGARFDVDPLWQAAMHLARHLGLLFGRDIAFTYGPLGFLAAPTLYFSDTGLMAIIYAVLVHLSFVATVFHIIARRSGYAWAAIAAFAFATASLVEGAELVPIVYALVALTALVKAGSQRQTAVVVLAGSSLGAFQLLVKFDTGVTVFLLATTLAFAVRGRARILLLAAHAGLSVVALGTLWGLSGQRFASLPHWMVRSTQIAAGYSRAMAIEVGTVSAGYGVPLLVLTGLAFIIWRSKPWERTGHPIVLAVVAAVIAYSIEKHSFVRHDQSHVVFFYLACALVPVALQAFRPERRWLTITALALTLLVAVNAHHPKDIWRPWIAKDQVATVIKSGERASFIRDLREDWRTAFQLDTASRALLTGRRVHIDPFQTLAAWAFNLDWTPVPVFQSYSAYTPELDAENARRLLAPDGPELILRNGTAAGSVYGIDNRNPMFESPQYMFSLICNFRQLRVQGQWEILGRSANRCASPTTLLSRSSASDVVRLPVPAPGGMLVAALRMETSLVDRILALGFKPRSVFIELQFRHRWWRRYRFVTATAEGPLVLCVPASANFDPRFVQTRCPTAVRLVGGSASRVTISGVPIAS